MVIDSVVLHTRVVYVLTRVHDTAVRRSNKGGPIFNMETVVKVVSLDWSLATYPSSSRAKLKIL